MALVVLALVFATMMSYANHKKGKPPVPIEEMEQDFDLPDESAAIIILKDGGVIMCLDNDMMDDPDKDVPDNAVTIAAIGQLLASDDPRDKALFEAIIKRFNDTVDESNDEETETSDGHTVQ